MTNIFSEIRKVVEVDAEMAVDQWIPLTRNDLLSKIVF